MSDKNFSRYATLVNKTAKPLEEEKITFSADSVLKAAVYTPIFVPSLFLID